jgi:two-component system cell cycle sensor histidine kinase/response regulator CckA
VAIIQNLLTLSRSGVTNSETVNLNKIVANYFVTPECKKLKYDRHGIKITSEIGNSELLTIKGSTVSLGKTVMNLISKASESISGREEIVLKTKNLYLDYPIKGYDKMNKGDYVVLLVSDTDKYISPNDLGKIF